MKRSFVALLLAMMLVIPTGIVPAEESAMICGLDKNTWQFSVALAPGEIERYTEVDLVITNPGFTLDKAVEQGAIYYADGKKTDAFGGVEFTVNFRNASYGIYQVYLIPSGNGKTMSQTFTYLQGNFSETFLNRANGAEGETEAAMKVLMNGKEAQTFLIDKLGETPADDALLYRYLVSGRPYTSLDEIQERHTMGAMLALLKEKDGAGRRALFDRFGTEYLGIAQNVDIFNMYSGSQWQMEICSAIQTDWETPAKVAPALYDATILVQVQRSSWGEISGVLNATKDYLKDIDYTKASEKAEQVGKAVAGKEYADVTALQKAIAEAYNKTDDTNANNSSGGGSGSGGRGYGSNQSGASIRAAVPPLQEEYEPEEVLFMDWDNIPDYAKPYLKRLKADGVFEGDPSGELRPNDSILRQEFCKVLITALKPEDAQEQPVFTDVASDAWYAEFVTKAAAAGYIQGKPDQTFGVDETLVREDLAVILMRILKIDESEVAAGTQYADNDEISDYAVNAVYAVTEAGIMEGDGRSFDPKGQVTRAQVAKVMGKLLYER